MLKMISGFKTEIVFIFIYCFFAFFYKTEIYSLDDLEKDRLISFFSIVSGIYITVLMLMCTTIISITRELLERSLDKKIIDIISLGLLETFVSVVMLIKKSNISNLYNSILVLILGTTFFSFIKFIIVLILIFKANMKAMSTEIEERERKEIELLGTLEKINTKLEKIKKIIEQK